MQARRICKASSSSDDNDDEQGEGLNFSDKSYKK